MTLLKNCTIVILFWFFSHLTGVLGSELKVSTANVFISRNGGLTWSELFEGTYAFNILDQGGALVAVDDRVHAPRNDIK
jgi:hypothetical protein